jgi:anti-sigma factor RsiW
MPDCASIEHLITPFVDGELTGAERLALERHLAACRPCRSRVVAERATRRAVREARPSLSSDRAPEALAARCRSLARTVGPTAANQRAARVGGGGWRAILARRVAPFALAATLVIIVGGAFVYQLTARSTRVLAAELAADHVKCFAMNAVLRTRHDAPSVERALSAGFGWNVHLPAQPERAGMELVGSRPCLYGEGKVAHVMYRHNGRPVSLFMLPKGRRSEELLAVLGHEAAIWSAGDRTFVLIAREARSEVQRMAAFVHAALH